MADEATQSPIKTTSIKLAIISLTLLCLVLALSLWLLDIKEKEKIAQERAEALKTIDQAKLKIDQWLLIEKEFKPQISSAEQAKKILLEAEKQLHQKQHIQTIKTCEKIYPLVAQAHRIHSQYLDLQKAINEQQTACQEINKQADHIRNYFEDTLTKILNTSQEITPLLNELKFTQVEAEISLWKQEASDLKKKIDDKNTEYKVHWAEAQKDDSLIAYKVFIESFPLTPEIEKIHKRTTELKQIAAQKKLEEEKRQKDKEEELKKQRQLIEERQAKLLAEQKQQRELEQVKTVEYEDGSSYTGQLFKEKPHGTGTYSYSNSNVYRGQWQDGSFHGTGSYEFYTGVTYKGNWQHGDRHGRGLVTWPNGDTFKGTWVKGKIHGRGLWTPKQGKAIHKNFHHGVDIGTKTYEAHMKYLDLQKDRYEGKRLSRSQQKSYGFMLRYNKALQMLYNGNPQVIFPDYPIHIPGHQSYLNSHSSSKSSDVHEMELKKIFFKLKRYALATKDAMGMEEEDEYSSSEMGGYNIITANLGVILDNSGSMNSYLDKLRYKIEKKFKKYAFIEVTGCSLYTNGDEVNHENALRSTLTAIKFLVNEKGVDTIYWFSDLNDHRSQEALEELTYFLEKNLISFYLSSVGNAPDKELKKIVTDSGGKVLKF